MWTLKSVVLAAAFVVSARAENSEFWETEFVATTGSPHSWSYQSGGQSGQPFTWTEIVTETVVYNGGSQWSSSGGSGGGSGGSGGGARWSSGSASGGGGGYVVKKQVQHPVGGSAVRRSGGGAVVQGNMPMASMGMVGGQKRLAGYQMVPAGGTASLTSGMVPSSIGGTSMLTKGSTGLRSVGMTSAVSSGRGSGSILPMSAIGK